MRMILIIFQKKKWGGGGGGEWTILGPKMAHPHNSRSIVKFFLNFAQ